MEKGNTLKTVLVIIFCVIVLIAILIGLYFTTQNLEEATKTSANVILSREEAEQNSIKEPKENTNNVTNKTEGEGIE